MSKMKLVNEVVEQAKASIDSLEELVRTLEGDSTEKEVIKEIKVTEKTYSLEEVRAKLADISRAGFTEEVKELIEKFGANKLSEIDPSKYADLMKEAKVIGND